VVLPGDRIDASASIAVTRYFHEVAVNFPRSPIAFTHAFASSIVAVALLTIEVTVAFMSLLLATLGAGHGPRSMRGTTEKIWNPHRMSSDGRT
jgi:hypothetical protein